MPEDAITVSKENRMISDHMSRTVSTLPAGTVLSRYLGALALYKGQAAVHAESMWRSTPEVALTLQRSVIEAGDTTTSGWGSQLVGTKVGMELLALLDSASIFNRLKPTMHELDFLKPTPLEDVPFM